MSKQPQKPGMPLRWSWLVLIFALLFVLMPFLFWRSTWFGVPLSESDIAEYLSDRDAPRKTQHALSQIADRILAGDESVRRWYPQVIEQARHPVDEIRTTAAWVMGQDNTAPEFRVALRGLLDDPNPMVRRNAALGLVRFADPAGLEEIRAMLQPYAERATVAGTLLHRLVPGNEVNPGTLIARIEQAGGIELELRTRVAGTLERWIAADRAPVSPGAEVALIAPSERMVWEALRALHLIGTPEDLPEVERYAAPVAGMSPRVAEQARETARAIRARFPEIE
jgi:hypothetical protein